MTVCLSPNGPNAFEAASAPTSLLVATIRGVAVLERARPGEAWRVARRTLDDRHVSALLPVPDGGLFAGAHNGGLYVSEDDGASWRPSADGITIDHVFSLAAAHEGGETVLYAGTEPVSLFRSRDRGRTWQELPSIGRVPGTEHWTFPPPPHTAHTKSFMIDRRDPRTILAAIEQGALLKTTDGGETWRELDAYYRKDDKWYRDIHRVIQMPTDPDELLMTTGMGLYRTGDFGETWEHLTGLDCRIAYPDHIVAAPENDDIVFMSGAVTDPSGWHATHLANGTVMKSTDRGRTWQPADAGLPDSGRPNIEAMCLAAWPGGFALFAGTTDGEVYASEDAAASWSRIADGLAPVSKVGHYRHVQPEAA